MTTTRTYNKRIRISIWSLCAAAFLSLAIGAGTASAATRYAAPGGTATDGVCITPQAAPCSIRNAAAGPNVVPADEAVIAPGEYTDADLDSDNDGDADSVFPKAGNVHGVAGLPRPRITLTTNLSFGAFNVEAGDRVSHIEVVTGVSTRNFAIRGGVLEGVVARSSRQDALVCEHVPSGTTAIIRDSYCLSTGSGSRAVGAGIGTFNATHTAVLRNVTAVATGANSAGVNYVVFGPADWDVDAKALLAQGTKADVAAGAGNADVDFVLANSNYSTVDTSFIQNGGTADVTPLGTAGNQTAEPSLAADGIHQLGDSPTIDAGGTVDQRSGTADIDGRLRTIGGATDIGADEFEHPTTTEVECTPGPLTAGSDQTECEVTVTDTFANPIVPTGEVTVSSDSPGQFSPEEVCVLAQRTPSQATCSVIYSPQQAAPGTHTLEAFYPGYTPHATSKDQTDVEVLAPPVTKPIDKGGEGTGATATPSKRCVRKGKKGKRKRCKRRRKRR
jgi:hypothetical protein